MPKPMQRCRRESRAAAGAAITRDEHSSGRKSRRLPNEAESARRRTTATPITVFADSQFELPAHVLTRRHRKMRHAPSSYEECSECGRSSIAGRPLIRRNRCEDAKDSRFALWDELCEMWEARRPELLYHRTTLNAAALSVRKDAPYRGVGCARAGNRSVRHIEKRSHEKRDT